jgi:glutamyl-tRNA synthetase
MSKRDGATSLMNFRDLGYLSEGIVNGISLLGWNPKTTEELFTMDELIQRFDLSMINTANPIFDTEKLNWINQQYLRKLTTEQLVARITELAKTAEQHNDIYQRFADWFPLQSEPRQLAIWQHLKERCHTLLEVAQSAQTDLAEYETDKLIWKKSTKDATIEIFAALIPELENIPEDDYIVEVIDPKIRQWIAAKGWGNGDVLWPMRYSLSGVPQSPSPFELAELLGKAETIRRLEKAQERLAA